jgi:Flp pilus assembly pilin Flp
MQNLVEKFTPAVEATDDDGVVAIEYVLVAGLVALGVAITFGSSLWTNMLNKLNGLFPAA